MSLSTSRKKKQTDKPTRPCRQKHNLLYEGKYISLYAHLVLCYESVTEIAQIVGQWLSVIDCRVWRDYVDVLISDQLAHQYGLVGHIALRSEIMLFQSNLEIAS